MTSTPTEAPEPVSPAGAEPASPGPEAASPGSSAVAGTASSGASSASAAADSQAARRPKKPRSWRWLRLVVPPAVVLVLVLVGTWIFQLEQPDEDDAAYLSPTSTAGIGAATLAGQVREAGVGIELMTKSSDALVAAYGGNATLFITTPELVNPYYLRMLKLLPASTNVVMIEPRIETISNGLLPYWNVHRFYVSEPNDPGCTYAPATKAGRASTRRTVYGSIDTQGGRELERCYGGSLVVFERGSSRITFVGSADPFRNDRIGEFHNARLATELLTMSPKLIWLDLHRREPPPLVNNDPALTGGPAAPPSLRPQVSGDPVDPDFPVRGGDDPGGQQVGGGGSGGGGAEAPNPLWQAFPPWTYVAAALLVLIFVLFALAQARRLGSPVVEPLPVVVRASETVAGRGRLYQRAKARAESLQTLRDSAVARLIHLLRLEPGVARPVLIEAVAAQSRWPAPQVEWALFGPPPEDDVELVHAATRLEQLLNAVATEQPVAAPHAPAAASEGEFR